MSPASPHREAAAFRLDQWSDSSSRDALRLVVESVTQMVGFELAIISLNDAGHLVTVAIEGPDEARGTILGNRTPVHLVESELAVAEDWGRFRFVPAGRSLMVDTEYSWIPDFTPLDGSDAWHPEDALLAPLYAGNGDLLGLLSIDLPLNRRRPDTTQRLLLERYAAQAERTLAMASERHELQQRLRLAEATREVVRFAASVTDVTRALDDSRAALLEGFRADDLIMDIYPADDAPGHQTTGFSDEADQPPEIAQRVRRLARDCWTMQTTAILTPYDGAYDRRLIDGADYQALLAHAREHLGYTSGMMVPIGAGTTCLGHLVLFRAADTVAWTDQEQTSSLDVARDIGHAVQSARNLAREQTLVTELRELASYKTELLSTVSHELKNPLSAIFGHLEMLAVAPDLSEEVRFSLSAVERASGRLWRVVDDLLSLAEVEDAGVLESAEDVDLMPLIETSLDLARLTARQHGIEICVSAPDRPLLVRGDPHDLDVLFGNLLSNAVKYSDPGGTIRVVVTSEGDGDLVVAVSDEGIGISEEDRERLFREFFRSTNPEALTRPGTGLGLAISARIVARHGGRIGVESELGRGSTFRVVLPQVRPQVQ